MAPRNVPAQLRLDGQARHPFEPAGQVPLPVAEQLHRRRQQHASDQVAERRPPTRVADELTAVLPQILQLMAGEADESTLRRLSATAKLM